MRKKQIPRLFAGEVENLFDNSVMPQVIFYYFSFLSLADFSVDLARVLVWALDSYDDNDPLNVAGEEISIKELSESIASLINVQSEVIYDLSYSDGPLKRTVSTKKFEKLYPTFIMTEFTAALESIIRGLTL